MAPQSVKFLHRRRYLVRNRTLSVIFFFFLASSSYAQTCRVPLLDKNIPESGGGDTVTVHSDTAEFIKEKTYRFQGDVDVLFDGHYMTADEVVYDVKTETVTVDGALEYQHAGLQATSNGVTLHRNPDTIEMHGVTYQDTASQANGTAHTLKRRGNVETELNQASYTTCPLGAPPAWQLRAERITLNHAAGWGVAKKASVRLNNVPVLYVPSISFPIDARRKSGWLSPTLDYSSTEGGAAYVPYYLNLRPNLDVTVTPGYIEQRGGWLGLKFRYLNPGYRALINLEGMEKDKLESDADRYLVGVYARHLTPGRVHWQIDYTQVSDDDYIDDFKGSFFADKPNYITQQGSISYGGDHWYANGRLYGVESLIDDTESYRYLPRLNAGWSQEFQGFRLAIDNQFTRFDHENPNKTIGRRLNTDITLSRPWVQSAFYIKPQWRLRQTWYRDLEHYDDVEVSQQTATTILDAGVFFDREEGEWAQTLEPRLYYVYRRADDGDVPNFDASAYTFSHAYLFSPDRYSGKDVADDMNRLTLGLGSRWTRRNDSRQVLRLNIAQAYDFDAKDYTNIAIEGRLNTAKFRLTTSIGLEPNAKRADQAYSGVAYTPNPKLKLRLAYRYREDEYDEIDVGGVWRMSDNWTIFGNERRSLEDNEEHSLERELGLAYQSCCWAVAASYRRELENDGSGAYDDNFRLHVELRGLGGAGNLEGGRMGQAIVPGW
jgi:LPS-assembly protein